MNRERYSDYNNAGTVLSTDAAQSIKNTKIIEKVYKLSTAGRETNNYTMVLISNDREYFEYLTL